MEYANILDDDIKVKKGYKISLIIIACIVVLLVGIGAYLYFNGNNSRSTYFKLIDSVSKEMLDVIETYEGKISKPIQSDYDISFELNSNSNEMKEIATILNKLSLKMNMKMDVNSKKASINLGALYNNEKMINADLYLINQNIYGNLNELYDKSIKINAEDVERIWEVYNFESYKIIIEEITNTLKDNLKEEIFSSSRETIEVLGKNRNVIKHSMTLNGNNIYDLEHRMLSEIETNNKLMQALISVSGLTEEEIKDSIVSTKEELVLEEDVKVTFEIYLNKNDIVKLSIKDNDEDVMTLNKSKENEFKISIKEKEEIVNIGYITFNDDIKAIINHEGFEMMCELSDTLLYLSTTAEDDVVELKASVSESSSNGHIRVVSSTDGLDLKINFTNKTKEIDKVDNIDVANYIELEQLTDEDYDSIMEALYQNNAVVKLIQDIMSLNTINSLNSY